MNCNLTYQTYKKKKISNTQIQQMSTAQTNRRKKGTKTEVLFTFAKMIQVLKKYRGSAGQQEKNNTNGKQ